MDDKSKLRRTLRKQRREYVAAFPNAMHALLFKRPPAPLMELIPSNAVIGLYYATDYEAPCSGYAKFFVDEGHALTLPRLNGAKAEAASMEFAKHTDPYCESDLEAGPFDIRQPLVHAEKAIPKVVFVPLVGFTERGERLGQGGGHYDRWLAEHSGTVAIGMGWDCQMVEHLLVEPHDVPLHAVVTPTRLYGPF